MLLNPAITPFAIAILFFLFLMCKRYPMPVGLQVDTLFYIFNFFIYFISFSSASLMNTVVFVFPILICNHVLFPASFSNPTLSCDVAKLCAICRLMSSANLTFYFDSLNPDINIPLSIWIVSITLSEYVIKCIWWYWIPMFRTYFGSKPLSYVLPSIPCSNILQRLPTES